jgi:hypothetical protein
MKNHRLKSTVFQLFATAIASIGAVAVLPAIVSADTLPGFTLFSGIDPGDRLNYSLNSGNRSERDTYRLRIPSDKIHRLGAAQFQIYYPNYYGGKFDEKNIEVMTQGKSLPIKAVKWDRQQQLVQIDLEDRLKPKGEVEIVLNNVQNPDFGGMFNFSCQVKSSAEFPIARYAGTWTLSID